MNEVPVGERLAAIETKLDMLVQRREDHEQRIRKLERWALLAGGAAGVVGGWAAQVIPNLG